MGQKGNYGCDLQILEITLFMSNIEIRQSNKLEHNRITNIIRNIMNRVCNEMIMWKWIELLLWDEEGEIMGYC
jgi:hypothetical protein